jgi:hypothetical protein
MVENVAVKESQTTSIQMTDVSSSSSSWDFVIDTNINNPDGFLEKLSDMRYVAYYRSGPYITGYVYTQNKKSQNRMEAILPIAEWGPMTSFSKHVEYCSDLASGVLIERGSPPCQGRRIDVAEKASKKRKGVEEECEKNMRWMNKETDKAIEAQQICQHANVVLTKQLADVTKQLADANQVNAELREQMGTTARNMMDLVTAYFQRDMRKTNRDLSFVLQRIYQLQPPLREDARFISSSTREGLAAALVKAKLHYHPDKQGIGDFWRTSICTEISKFLNFAQEQFNGTLYDWK